MRLSNIYLSEGINKTDFYDFYALLNAYYNNKNDLEIKKHLNLIADIIYDDHMMQLGRIILNRISDPDHKETAKILNNYGVSFNEDFDLVGAHKLSISDLISIISRLITFDHHFDITGKTWLKLSNVFVNIGSSVKTLHDKILAIDKIYGLLHHGGMITDYMDEKWLEDALNTRDSATSAQIFANASSNVRSIIGRASYAGQMQTPVDDFDKVHTALLRVAKTDLGQFVKDVSIDKKSNKIVVSLKIVKDAKELSGLVIVDNYDDKLVIRSKYGMASVFKPINYQHKLAMDIIAATKFAALKKRLVRGDFYGAIADSYS